MSYEVMNECCCIQMSFVGVVCPSSIKGLSILQLLLLNSLNE